MTQSAVPHWELVRQSTFNVLKEVDETILLCTEDDIQLMNYRVRWTKNLNETYCSLIGNCATNLSIPLERSSSGFYCCQVIRNSNNSTVFTTCATVVIQGTVDNNSTITLEASWVYRNE